MRERGYEALLLTTKADIQYFTGLRTEFFESPTRPWFVVVPAKGDAVALVPEIGVPLMRRAHVGEIRAWASPNPRDEGVSLLAQALRETAGKGGPVAVPMQPGTTLGFSLGDFLRLRDGFDWRDDGGLVRDLRMVKSEGEIAAIRQTCVIADRAFARVPDIAHAGMALDDVFRRFRMALHEEGADEVRYLAGAAGQGGYEDVISPATQAPIREGDVLMLDTGAVRGGYFCDFDRNFAIGEPSDAVRDAHRTLREATLAGAEAMKPGATCADVHAAMVAAGCDPAGRAGHGLGLQLTEPPSIARNERTVLRENMVMTIEPVVALGDGRIMVHEENVVVREGGVDWFTGPPGTELGAIP